MNSLGSLISLNLNYSYIYAEDMLLVFQSSLFTFILPQYFNQIDLNKTKFLLVTVLNTDKEDSAQFSGFWKFIVIYQKCYNDFTYIFKFILAHDMKANLEKWFKIAAKHLPVVLRTTCNYKKARLP